MEEKKLIEGKFIKLNYPAIICLMMAILFGILSSDTTAPSDEMLMWQILTIFFGILTFFFLFGMSGCNITVTNRRVYGTGSFRKRVDLPFDMISSVGSGSFNSITVATSSGKIHFWFVANRNDVFQAISKCLIDRQQDKSGINIVKQDAPESDIDKLRQYKELLDMGVITQEEFDAKKKQLLGL